MEATSTRGWVVKGRRGDSRYPHTLSLVAHTAPVLPHQFSLVHFTRYRVSCSQRRASFNRHRSKLALSLTQEDNARIVIERSSSRLRGARLHEVTQKPLSVPSPAATQGAYHRSISLIARVAAAQPRDLRAIDTSSLDIPLVFLTTNLQEVIGATVQSGW